MRKSYATVIFVADQIYTSAILGRAKIANCRSDSNSQQLRRPTCIDVLFGFGRISPELRRLNTA